MNAQLPLALRLPAASRLDNFVSGGNREVVAAVRELLGTGTSGVLFLAGAAGTGKTHLLQAACRAVETDGGQAAYLPLRDLVVHPPALLEGLEQYRLIACDDVQAIAGRSDWEEAVFHLYNRLRETGGSLLGAGRQPPERLGLGLPDLRSRLASGGVYALQAPDDAGLQEILILHAYERGLELPAETAQFLLRRCPRDLHALVALLDRLDRAALRAQRRLTVPFVRAVMESDGE
ncbi:MAG TPA: DnaA regulatory inactivator Hda [Gammaproteobacteria bacterium]